MRLKELKNKIPISETDGEVNVIRTKRNESERQRRDKEMSDLADFVEEDTDEVAAQRMDKPARIVAIGIIFLKSANKEIRAKDLSQLTW